MPDQESSWKLNPRQKLRLCSLLAIGYNPERCRDILFEEDGIEVSPQNIRQNYLNSKKWQKFILRMRREAERLILNHPLAHKINRLNLLQAAINEAFAWRLHKVHYNKDGKEVERIEKRNIGMVASLVKEARTEIEGDKPTTTIDNSKHYHTTTIEQLHVLADNKDAEGDNGAVIPKNRLESRTGEPLIK